MPLEANEEIERIPVEERIRPQVYFARFRVYASLDRWELAEAVACHLVKFHPSEPEHWLAQAACARQLDSIDAAEAVLRTARSIHPDCGGIWYALAGLACMSHRTQEARDWLEKAFRCDPKLRLRMLDDDAMRPVWDEIANLE